MIESNTKLNDVHPSIKEGDMFGAKKLVNRTKLECEEVERR